MGQPKGYTRTPLWEARRNHSYLTTMLEHRKDRFAKKLAADQAKLDAIAEEIAKLEAEAK